uniref:(northern house mosquito) hypothetical protein n=1 Tax=Culex pipiens TaxID=7175 RepID=A0A8D8CZ20_CULPI
MAFICFVCKNHFVTVDLLTEHYYCQHNLKPTSTMYCAQGDCTRYYPSTNSLKRHFQHSHKELFAVEPEELPTNPIFQPEDALNNTSPNRSPESSPNLNEANQNVSNTDVHDFWGEVRKEIEAKSNLTPMQEIALVFVGFLNSLPNFNREMVFQTSAAVEEVINARKERLHGHNIASRKFHLQPTVMVIGPESKPRFTVVFDNIIYQYKTLIDAIAGVITTTYVLDLEYNADAIPAWTFIQEYLFRINPKKKIQAVDEAARILVNWT